MRSASNHFSRCNTLDEQYRENHWIHSLRTML